MPRNTSEAYLAALAERTFLKPWAIPNPFHRPGKEISDVIVPFGDDVIIFSDKASLFDVANGAEIGWSRWRRATIDESVKQLRGAVRRLNMPDAAVFIDDKARNPLAFALPPLNRRRYHLVGLARPHPDPAVIPPGWLGLTYSDAGRGGPFRVGRCLAGGDFVHIFDGETFDVLLGQLDTTPDLIAYLGSREAALRTHSGLTFAEPDLLALATESWMNGRGFSIDFTDRAGPSVSAGAWDAYAASDRARQTKAKNKASRTIDNLITQFHVEFLAGGGIKAEPGQHEEAMRLLAAESRFARRMIAASLTDILDEQARSVFWASTVPSPTKPRLRYVWLAYPAPPPDMAAKTLEKVVHDHLRQHVLVAADHFGSDVVVGVAVPNRATDENLYIMEVMDARGRTDRIHAEAAHWRAQGIFADLEQVDHLHQP